MVKLEKIQMTDEDLKEKKLHLASCKISKDESDLTLKEMEETLDTNLATKLLDDDIAKIKEDIAKKRIFDNYGKEEKATDADLERMNIVLNKFIIQKKLDLPTRKVRFELQKLIDAKERIDAPEKQIKKLEKEIREKAYYMTARKTSPTMMD